ncbi:MAG: PAS domain S-box protein [Ignavibacteria bacterium]|nr:PAS domain S-box protein [Ignavibacteria bacterium]
MDEKITERKKIEDKLREREQLLSSIYNTVGDVIFHLAVEGEEHYRFESVNAAFSISTGLPKEAVIGKMVNEVIPEPSLSMVLGKYRQAIEEKTIVRWEETSDYPTGRKTGEVSVAPVFDDSGRCTHLVGSVHVITERKKAEEEVRQYAEQYNKMKSTDLFGYWLVDENAKLLDVNEHYSRMSGYTREELLNLTVPELEGLETSDETVKRIQRVIEAGTMQFESKHRAKDGHVFDVEINVVYWYSKRKFITFINDITERKQAELQIKDKTEQLKLLSEELEIIIDSIPGLVFYKDSNNRFIRVNKYIADAYKMEKSKLEGMSLFDLHEKKQAQAYYEDDLVVIRSGKAKLNINEPWETETGLRWVNTSKVPYVDETGKVVGVIGISMDVTERKVLEEELKKHRQHLEKLVEKRTRELNLSNKELEQVLFTTSHDLRSPLVNVQGFTKELDASIQNLLSILSDADISQELRKKIMAIVTDDIPESIKYILKSTSKMDGLLNGLLRLSRVGRQKLTMNEIDMNKLISEVVSTFEHQIKDNNVKLEIWELPKCYGNSNLINQVFSNLIENAIKFTNKNQNAIINISGEKTGNRSVYYVKDNGIGIDSEHKDKIYDIFHQLNPSKKGTGLGLTIVKRIIDKHNGSIDVESTPKSGSKFIIELPGT